MIVAIDDFKIEIEIVCMNEGMCFDKRMYSQKNMMIEIKIGVEKEV